MFQFDWYDGNIYKEFNYPIVEPIGAELLKTNDVEAVYLTFWAEHCLECAPPECYRSCNYYQKRKDGRCKRTAYGQKRIINRAPYFPYSSQMKFLKWSKLETKIFTKNYATETYVKFIERYERNLKFINFLDSHMRLLNLRSFWNGVQYFHINKWLPRFKNLDSAVDKFIFQVFSYEKTSFRWVMEAVTKDKVVVAKNAVTILPGYNNLVFNYEDICNIKMNPEVFRMYPENNLEISLCIYTAEFVKLAVDSALTMDRVSHADKVKCVAWDLDNTIWNGVAVDQDESEVTLRPDIITLIKEFDKRGILQTVVSKNDYEIIWPVLKKLKISDYFLYPQINWNRKSQNLTQVAKELNINLDTFALIDDSDFERYEVKSVLPQVRVYDEKLLLNLLNQPEFDVLITEDSKRRRTLYKTEEERVCSYETYNGDYLSFLRSCEMIISIFPLTTTEIIDRCYELLQRTNQLNLTGNKYTQTEFMELLSNEEKELMAISCSDRFGEYGIIAFVIARKEEAKVVIEELTISCRVAKKHLEYTLFSFLARKYLEQDENGYVVVNYKKTSKNQPIFHALLEIGFIVDSNDVMSIPAKNIKEDDGIVGVVNKG